MDIWGRTVQVIPPTGPSVTYDYDTLDRMTSAVRGNVTTTLTYDLAGRKTGMFDPDMGSWSYTYYALGTLWTQTDARGCVTTLGYDELNRLTSKTYTGPGACDSTPDVSYTYDQGTNGIGQRTRMDYGTGFYTAWTYDARGRMTQESKTLDSSNLFTAQWEYNSADLVKLMKYPSNNLGGITPQVDYSYLPQKLLNTVASTTTYVKSTSYDAAGRVDIRLLGDSGGAAILRTDYDYFAWSDSNGIGRLKRIKSEDLSPCDHLAGPALLQHDHRRFILRRRR